MPITSSAKKAMRQTKKRTLINRKNKETLKDAIKKYRKLIAAKKMDDAKKTLAALHQVIDKSAKNKVIKKNTAARLKSRLSVLVK
jgi:small subunit ribosomal protein S20